MTANTMGSTDPSEKMDVVKFSITDEQGQHQYELERPGLAGPLNASASIRFIVLSDISNRTADPIPVYLDNGLLETLATNNINVDDQMDEIKRLAKEYWFNLHVCTIDHHDQTIDYFNATLEQENQCWYRAYLVYDKQNRSFYPFFQRDNNGKYYTIFPKNDALTLSVLEHLVAETWSSYISPGNTPTTNPHHHHTVNTGISSESADIPVKRFKPNECSLTRNTETNDIVRDKPMNNHQQKILSSDQPSTESSLPDNPHLPTSTNTNRQALTTDDSNERIKLLRLKLLNQPKRFRHNRETKTVGHGCPAVQIEGAPQRTPLLLKLPEKIRDYCNQQFYIGTHVKTYDGDVHAQTHVIPMVEKVKKRHGSKSVEQEDCDEFDLKSCGVFSKINTDKLIKKISVPMCNLTQDGDITKKLIEEKKLNWCRLMFAIYIKLSDGEFQAVSPPTYSDLIEQTRTSQIPSFKDVFPDTFCERGGQMIFIKIAQLIEKQDLRVHCNGKVLHQEDYQIAKIPEDTEMIMSFETPECVSNEKNLQIAIDKPDTTDWMTLQYRCHPHGNHTRPCGVIHRDE